MRTKRKLIQPATQQSFSGKSHAWSTQRVPKCAAKGLKKVIGMDCLPLSRALSWSFKTRKNSLYLSYPNRLHTPHPLVTGHLVTLCVHIH